MLEVDGVSKRYGARIALDDVSFAAQPGSVTGFLGPNGAGKTTTIRIILGLDQPDRGRAMVNGRRLADHPNPLVQAGSLIDARSASSFRSAEDHLRWIAATHGFSRRRVDAVLEQAGLETVAGRRVGRLSLGMCQRLGLAAALLGDPSVLVLDEPVNGLDPNGIHWLRATLRILADEGRTVFLSSHLVSELALIADHLVVMGQGRVLADATPNAIIDELGRESVSIRSSDSTTLRRALEMADATVDAMPDGSLVATGVPPVVVGDCALQLGIALYELVRTEPSLEEAYFALTADATEHVSRDQR